MTEGTTPPQPAPAGGAPVRPAFGWRDDALELGIDVDGGGVARITRLAATPTLGPTLGPRGPLGLPLVDVITFGTGRAWSGTRYCESLTGTALSYLSHQEEADGPWRELRVDLGDPVTGLRAEVYYRVLAGQGALRAWVRLSNQGSQVLTVESVTSFLAAGLPGSPGATAVAPADGLGCLDLHWAENDWLAEGRWQCRGLRDVLPDLNRIAHGADPRGRFGVTSTGTWSSGGYLPAGVVTDRSTGHALAWQIEHNGGWHWQVGECTTRRRAPGDQVTGGAYLALLGPTDAEHQWRLPLAPGESFTTVPVAIAVSDAGFEGAIARLTACRRASRRPHPDHQRLPVIFNDYMNTIMADPTTERLLPLISAAARAGAEYFCIDAGWYADLGEDWWGSVGAWQPSAARFPGGITEVLDHIRAEGMIPGLWLEPEVVGVHSPVATQLPPEAFFCRGGVRVIEQDRYHLDLRHPAALKHLNEVVDFLVGDLGVGYLKLDYNIDVAPGTETGGVSPGAGLLGHNRALLDWLDGVLDRHPGLTIENCGSGGMRVDYGLLSRVQLQSTSDQQDFLRYPPIAAGLAAAITPEQAAVWAYPQPAFSDDEITFTMSGALLSRIHLSGHLDQMTEAQQELVAEAVRVYKDLRADLASAVPFWPLGLPHWNDSWLALGMRPPATPAPLTTPAIPATPATPGTSASAEVPANADVSYLVVWHRGALDGAPANTGPAPHTDPTEVVLPLPHLRGHQAVAEVLYPGQGRAAVAWSGERGELTIVLPATPTACLIRLTPTA